MAKNGNTQLGNAKAAKNDEFYTQLADIQAEVNAYLDFNPDVFRGKTVLLPCDDPEWSNFTRFFAQNFERFGLKKLISTSYAFDSKRLGGNGAPRGRALPGKGGASRPGEPVGADLRAARCRSADGSSPSVGANLRAARNGPYWQPTLFESESPQYDAAKSPAHGKIFVLDRDTNDNGTIDFSDLQWSYLEGDGDFRSDEVRRLRDEADIIVTNPPFSLFREFLAWIMEADKKFLIIGNQNAITYKEVFPLIKGNEIWFGKGFKGGVTHFISDYTDYATAGDHRAGMIRVSGVVWFTNLDHGRRHQPLQLMTMADNIKFSKHKEVRGQGYLHYDNYDAIEVPFTDAIPDDYDGVMGVPISFLDKYCPEQFEILGSEKQNEGIRTKIYPEQIQVESSGKRTRVTKLNDGAAISLPTPPSGVTYYQIGNATYAQVYKRIFIRHKKGTTK